MVCGRTLGSATLWTRLVEDSVMFMNESWSRKLTFPRWNTKMLSFHEFCIRLGSRSLLNDYLRSYYSTTYVLLNPWYQQTYTNWMAVVSWQGAGITRKPIVLVEQSHPRVVWYALSTETRRDFHFCSLFDWRWRLHWCYCVRASWITLKISAGDFQGRHVTQLAWKVR